MVGGAGCGGEGACEAFYVTTNIFCQFTPDGHTWLWRGPYYISPTFFVSLQNRADSSSWGCLSEKLVPTAGRRGEERTGDGASQSAGSGARAGGRAALPPQGRAARGAGAAPSLPGSAFLPSSRRTGLAYFGPRPRAVLAAHPHVFFSFLPLSASVMTSTKGEMMESIFIGMISIKYQLTWSLSHACTASRVNVHLISQRSARLQGNDPQTPGTGRCTLPPFEPPSCPCRHPRFPAPGTGSLGGSPPFPAGGAGRASVLSRGPEPQAAQSGRAGRRRPGQRARGYRAGSARPPRPCAAGVSAAPGERAPAGGAGAPRLGWIRAGLGRVFFLPEERHM